MAKKVPNPAAKEVERLMKIHRDRRRLHILDEVRESGKEPTELDIYLAAARGSLIIEDYVQLMSGVPYDPDQSFFNQTIYEIRAIKRLEAKRRKLSNPRSRSC